MPVQQNGEQPRAEAAGAVVAANGAPGLDERLGNQVLSRAQLMSQAAGLLQQAAFMLRRQLAESRRFSRSCPNHEIGAACDFRAVSRNEHLSINPVRQ